MAKKKKKTQRKVKHKFGVLKIPKDARLTDWDGLAWEGTDKQRGDSWESPDPRKAGGEEEE